jgi:hypothetical protein
VVLTPCSSQAHKSLRWNDWATGGRPQHPIYMSGFCGGWEVVTSGYFHRKAVLSTRFCNFDAALQ